jgi:hypothetical protein
MLASRDSRQVHQFGHVTVIMDFAEEWCEVWTETHRLRLAGTTALREFIGILDLLDGDPDVLDAYIARHPTLRSALVMAQREKAAPGLIH